MSALTISKYIHFLLDDAAIDDCPRWPPDAFAIAGALLQRSGAYRLVITQWPPAKSASWSDDIGKIGDDWREHAAENKPVPDAVAKLWQAVLAKGDHPVDDLGGDLDLAHTLLQLSAAADEAAADAGIFVGQNDAFSRLALRQLREKRGRTLCRDVDASRAVVLPKLHTAQTGLTMRSLTHHLALYLAGQIRPRWHDLTAEQELTKVLILPWPLKVDPKHFSVSGGDPANMPGCYGYFSYDLSYDSRGFMLDEAVKAIDAAKKKVGHVDAVVFPELALRGDDYIDLCAATDTMIIAGVGTPPQGQKLATNSAAVAIPTGGDMQLSWKQSKHHRWRLDEGQIKQYSLHDKFDPAKFWWEHIELSERSLHFLTLNNIVTMAVLICEDLARLDPVSELVMSVGPTLVVALLMDGPQISKRWPGRYATVLADDPRSSVLSVTSLGMAKAYSSGYFKPSSVFALWKDAFSPPKEIEMKAGAVGVVLNLKSEQKEEWTADGRTDYGETFYLRLDGEPEEIVL